MYWAWHCSLYRFFDEGSEMIFENCYVHEKVVSLVPCIRPRSSMVYLLHDQL